MKKADGNILIVDDDKTVLRSLEILLKPKYCKIKTLNNPARIQSTLFTNNFDIVLLDMNFTIGEQEGKEGLFWLKEIKKINPNIIVILFTAFAEINLAVEGMKLGATDFIMKPWNNEKLISTINTSLKLRLMQKEVDQLQNKNELLSKEINKTDEFIGQSDKINEIKKICKKIAKTDTNILITGENGTGKEILARYIHSLSLQKNAPFIKVDLGAITETLFESELFGHKKGAFTDAKENKTGRLLLSSGGTLFLDEVSNVSIAQQSKLLSVLQNMEVIPVGSDKPIKLDARIIAATNKDLSKLIEENEFREDLFYRINTIQIKIPALRDRKDDILILANHYLNTFSIKYQKVKLFLNNSAQQCLQNYDWPGNIRELKHAMEKAVILAEGDSLNSDNFVFQGIRPNKEKEEWPLSFEEIERKAILRAIENNNGKLIDAAKELGLTRQTLHNKLKKYNVRS
jgi:DNA-binding NtrC family response regulator